jgi:hypothetical protein
MPLLQAPTARWKGSRVDSSAEMVKATMEKLQAGGARRLNAGRLDFKRVERALQACGDAMKNRLKPLQCRVQLKARICRRPGWSRPSSGPGEHAGIKT